MIELILSNIPSTIAPYFIERWKNRKTRFDAWLELAEYKYNQKWAFQLYVDKNKCSPRVSRFAYGCRWDSMQKIRENHGENRVVIDGHFSYLVRNDLALQSICFAFDKALITSLIDDELIKKRIFGGLSEERLNNYAGVLFDYFGLNHRKFYENYLGNTWLKMGMPNREFLKLFDNKGKLNLKNYIIKIKKEYKETIEYELVTRTKVLLDIMEKFEVKQYTAIQPNTVIGIKNGCIEYIKKESMLDFIK